MIFFAWSHQNDIQKKYDRNVNVLKVMTSLMFITFEHIFDGIKFPSVHFYPNPMVKNYKSLIIIEIVHKLKSRHK